MSTAVRPLDCIATCDTPEHVQFSYRLAGPAARGVALLLDLLVQLGIALGLGIVLGLTIGLLLPGFTAALMAIASLLVTWFYGALLEWLWSGQTVGKRALGIRVVGSDGLPAGFQACLLRNLLRFADFLPTAYAAGLICMSIDPRMRRLGDLAAGTMVVYRRERPPRPLPKIERPDILALAGRIANRAAAIVDGECVRAINHYLERSGEFTAARRREMAQHLADPLIERLDLPRDTDPDHLLAATHVAITRGADPSSGGHRGANQRLAGRRKAWKQLNRFTEAGRITPPTPGAVVDAAQLYRGACADLALADAYHMPDNQVRDLNDLVAQGHIAFYRRIRLSLVHLMRQAFVVVPAQLIRDPALGFSLLAFFGFFIICAVAAAVQPDFAYDLLGADTIQQYDAMYESAPRDRGADEGMHATGFYIEHNVGIALGCFAAGIFLGIGSLMMLAYNGVVLGTVFGYMWQAEAPIGAHFYEFVSAHGPFELGGIAFCGAAGLRLGMALVITHGCTIGESLRRSAPRTVPILVVGACFVALAAPIEGLISPSALPLAVKRAVMWLCLLLMLGYLLGCGMLGILAERRAANEQAEREDDDGPL